MMDGFDQITGMECLVLRININYRVIVNWLLSVIERDPLLERVLKRASNNLITLLRYYDANKKVVLRGLGEM